MNREGSSWSCLPHECPSAVLSLSNSKEPVLTLEVSIMITSTETLE